MLIYDKIIVWAKFYIIFIPWYWIRIVVNSPGCYYSIPTILKLTPRSSLKTAKKKYASVLVFVFCERSEIWLPSVWQLAAFKFFCQNSVLWITSFCKTSFNDIFSSQAIGELKIFMSCVRGLNYVILKSNKNTLQFQSYTFVRVIPQGTVDNNLGPKALDPNYSRQPTLWLHDLCLEVLTVNVNELRLFGAKAFTLLILLMFCIWHSSSRYNF